MKTPLFLYILQVDSVMRIQYPKKWCQLDSTCLSLRLLKDHQNLPAINLSKLKIGTHVLHFMGTHLTRIFSTSWYTSTDKNIWNFLDVSCSFVHCFTFFVCNYRHFHMLKSVWKWTIYIKGKKSNCFSYMLVTFWLIIFISLPSYSLPQPVTVAHSPT